MTRDATGQTGRPGGWGRRSGPPGLLALVLLAAPLPAAAQAPGTAPAPPGGSLDGILRTLQLKAKPSTAPDFVRKSRRPATDFVPVGRQHPERSVKVMTPAEIEATTAGLDKARIAQQQRAGVKPPPIPLKQPKDSAATRKTRDR